MTEISLIKIDGELTKPATVLLEKVSAALGVIYEPTRIKRKAKAEAEASKIQALATIEITDLEQRAINRLVSQQARKQKNIEQITEQAASALPLNADVERLEEDWIAHFFERCENVSDNEMQSVWSKLLAGEATKPGSYSKRTIDFVSSLDKKDAELFTKFCKFVWQASELTPFIIDFNNEVYKKEDITFQALVHLDSIGLIKYETSSGFKLTFGNQETQTVGLIEYYQRALSIEFPSGKHDFSIGCALLTKIGIELAAICGSEPKQDFYEYCVKKISEQNLILSSNPYLKGF